MPPPIRISSPRVQLEDMLADRQTNTHRRAHYNTLPSLLRAN